jgi:maleamate amidohydrolase
MAHPWDGVITATDLAHYKAAGWGGPSGIGVKPVLLVIDVQYRTTGTVAMPFDEAVKEFPTSCGEEAWAALPNIVRLIRYFRRKGFPVIFPHVAPKKSYDVGRLGAKIPSALGIQASGYDFVREAAPEAREIVLPKNHPSAFFGTPLVSYLIDAKCDTLVMTGCTTSGCIRASVIDAFSNNFRVLVAHDAVYDRGAVSHAVNLFDMAQKYADVKSTAEAIEALETIQT